jgi:hypothetical protein
VITSIPLNTRRQDDFWAWHFEKRDLFSVCSTYRWLAHRKSLARSAGASDRQAVQKEWPMLWGIKVPSKVRVFPWRLDRCSLPSKDILLHRNMSDSSACSICGARDSWRHSLIECNMARYVWAREKDEIIEHICHIEDQDARGWLVAVMRSLKHEDLILVTVTLWAIWYAR